MQRKNSQYLLYVVLLISSAVLWGCPKKTEVASAPEAQSEKVVAAPAPAPATETAAAETKSDVKTEGSNEKSGVQAEGLKPVYFDFDKSFIRDDAKSLMRANAEWLKANPSVKVRIEGSCDDRGTKEYNQALGQRRAVSAKKYLIDLGVSGRRIALVSYGKEKPVCGEEDEACWQRNRRDDFVVVNE